jgi:rubrerythrin
MSLDVLPVVYVATLLLGLGAVAVFNEIRRRRFEPTPTADRVFRCEKCAFVYTDDADVDRSRCPQCGAENERIEF